MIKIKTVDPTEPCDNCLNFTSMYKVKVKTPEHKMIYNIIPSSALYEPEWDKMTENGQRTWLVKKAIKLYIKDHIETDILEVL